MLNNVQLATELLRIAQLATALTATMLWVVLVANTLAQPAIKMTLTTVRAAVKQISLVAQPANNVVIIVVAVQDPRITALRAH